MTNDQKILFHWSLVIGAWSLELGHLCLGLVPQLLFVMTGTAGTMSTIVRGFPVSVRSSTFCGGVNRFGKNDGLDGRCLKQAPLSARQGANRVVRTGLSKTFQILCRTNNEAAVPWLIGYLDNPNPELQCGALEALLARHSSFGHQELLRRWTELTEPQLEIVDQHPNRLSTALRDGVLSADADLNRNACLAAVRLREYDLIPTLVRAAEDKSNPFVELAADAVLALAEHLFHDISAPRDYRQRRDPALVRQFVHNALEQSVRKYGNHRRTALVEAFLLLVKKEDSLLKYILNEPDAVSYAAVIGQLTSSPRPGVMRLVLEMLEQPHAPAAILHVASRRRDETFVRLLLARHAGKLTTSVKNNLRKVETWSWLRDDSAFLATLNDEELCGAVRLATASAINRLRAFDVVKFALQHGPVFARRTASESLAEFKGSEANESVLLALADKDPEVQSYAVGQLRERGIPGALHKLVEMLASPHEIVQNAVHAALSEFTFPRFLATYEMMDKETRYVTGSLVKRVDPDAVGQLQVELTSLSRTRRIRGLELAVAMQMTREVEDEIMTLSADSDHFIRAASTQALVRVNSARALQRLQELRMDRAASVREAVEDSLDGFISIPDPFAVPSVQPALPVSTSESQSLESAQGTLS